MLCLVVCLDFLHSSWVIQLPEVLFSPCPLTIELKLKAYMSFSFLRLTQKDDIPLPLHALSDPLLSVSHAPPFPPPGTPSIAFNTLVIWNYVYDSEMSCCVTLQAFDHDFPSACGNLPQWFSGRGSFALLGDSWQHLETFLVVITWGGILLSSSGKWSGMHTSLPQRRIIWPQCQ